MLEGLNFKEFIALLSAFSAHATQQDKINCEFSVFG
jgi:Ca2+-binding EF-hand superfamily protein